MIFSILRATNSFSEMLILLLAVVLAALVAIISLEVAHGYVALRFGDPTAKLSGRLTANPAAHFDLLGLGLLLLVGFGWAKPVPINPNNFTNYRKGMIWVSVAGVITNIIIGCILLVALYFLAPYLVVSASTSSIYLFQQLVLYFIIYTIQINFILAFFNMLPIYPLDGFRLLSMYLKPGNRYAVFMYKYGLHVLIGLIVVGRVFSSIGLHYLDIFQHVFNFIYKLIIFVLNARGIGA